MLPETIMGVVRWILVSLNNIIRNIISVFFPLQSRTSSSFSLLYSLHYFLFSDSWSLYPKSNITLVLGKCFFNSKCKKHLLSFFDIISSDLLIGRHILIVWQARLGFVFSLRQGIQLYLFYRRIFNKEKFLIIFD